MRRSQVLKNCCDESISNVITIVSEKAMKHKVSKRLGLTAIVFLLALITTFAHANWPIGLITEGGKPSLAPLLETRTAAIVQISIVPESRARRIFGDPLLDRFYGREPEEPKEHYSGSGVVIDATKGYIVTNHHVINGAAAVYVTLQDLRKFKTTIVGSDEPTDVALLQINADDLTELPLGDSDQLKVGDFVIAIGNPFGLGQTVTTGVVSGLGRNLPFISTSDRQNYEDFIQTDASINPGNSGGALIDLNGNLVGINTAIVSASGTSSGIGFAVPSNMATSIIDQLLEHGNIQRGIFGVDVLTVTPDVAELYELPTRKGALVRGVVSGSSAESAGIQVEDVIVAVDTEDIEDASDLQNVIGLQRIGNEFDLTLVRDGRRKTIRTSIEPIDVGPRVSPNNQSPLHGVTLTDIPPTHNSFRRNSGLLVFEIETDSLAYAEGLRSGDVIRAINRQGLRNLKSIDEQMLNQSPLFLLVLRGRAQFIVALQ